MRLGLGATPRLHPGPMVLLIILLPLLALPATAVEEGSLLTYTVSEGGGEARVTFKVLDPQKGVVVVESREYTRRGGLLVLPSLEPGTKLGPLDPWTPEEACMSIHPLAPDGYTGEVTKEGDDYRWYCKYQDGVLVELEYEDPTLTLYMSLEYGPGSLGQALAVLGILLLLAVLGLAWLRRKAKSM